MSARPPELDFATPDGREATPERMNRAMDYIIARFKAFESVVPEFQTAINAIRATGLVRLDEALTPILEAAESMRVDILAIRDEMQSTAFRDALVADAAAAAIAASFGNPAQRASLINDIIAAIDTQDLYIRAGAGVADVAMFGGTVAPLNTLGKDGDLYVQTP